MRVLEAELGALRARLDRLEKRVDRCEARDAAPPAQTRSAPVAAPLPQSPAPPSAPPPADPAEETPAGSRPSSSARQVLVPTGQTLAAKVRFLDAQCRELVRCSPALLSERERIPGMALDEVRRFTSAVGRCAHQCAVEMSVGAALAAQPPRPAPDELTGIKSPEDPRGLPLYPGPDADADALRSFLSVRCQELACARLGLPPASGGEGPAVTRFLSTCAQACAEQKGLDIGQ